MAGEAPPPSGPPPGSAPNAEVAARKPAVRVFQCPACGATLEIKAVGQTITVGCRSCGATLDTSRDDVQLVEKGKLLARQVYLSIGSRGNIGGAVFEVIGVMGRIDVASNYGWKEYLLYNPYQGFRWLSEAGGHWSFVTPLKEAPKVDDSVNFQTGLKPRAILGGRTYAHFQYTDARVDFVLGEFYWRVKKGDASRMADYVDPPELLSVEMSGNERIWSRCVYVTPAELEAAFKLPAHLPYPMGVAPNQPNPHRERWVGLRNTWGMFTAVLFSLFVFHQMASPKEVVFTENFHYDSSSAEKTRRVGPFELAKGGNFELELQSRVENASLDLDAELVNEITGESHDLQLATEYWSGYDSDGSWSEGSNHSSDLEAGVGPGTYHLNLTPSGASGSGGARYETDYSVTGKRGVPVGSNLVLTWLILSILPIWTALRSAAFESERWSNSDYANTGGGGDDDDDD